MNYFRPRALDHIAKKHPDEDVTELVAANLVFEQLRSFHVT
ncbi:hypothetical protein PATA110615_00150 [Paenibacillus taichungensis]